LYDNVEVLLRMCFQAHSGEEMGCRASIAKIYFLSPEGTEKIPPPPSMMRVSSLSSQANLAP